jgi:hypothetical protein
MVVQTPKVLDRVERDDGPLVLLPRTGAVVFEEPKGPRVLQKEKMRR